jgi:phenylacetate-CoA ligase
MPPPGPYVSLLHRVRSGAPLRVGLRFQLARFERADAGVIRAMQERRLRGLVRWAALRSPFYRRFFRESGVDFRAIRTVEDLGLLPLVSRDHLVERPLDFCAYPPAVMWQAHSSGTSGRPVTCYRTAGSSVFELCALERQWSWFGLGRGVRRLVLRGGDFAAGGGGVLTKVVPGASQLLVSSFHLVAANVDSIMAEVRAFGPDVVEGWPSSIALLAGLLDERGLRFPVSAVITSSESMTAARVGLIEEVFEAPVVDHYGQTERVVMAGACEHGGYHVFPDYGIVELLPVAGVASRWELVGTGLHNWGFPLLRYRTGDEVGAAASGPCGCGRAFPLLGRIGGRVEDSFTAADGRPLPLPGSVIDDLVGVREAQVAQLGWGCFEVRVVPGPGFDELAVQRAVRRNVDRFFGVGQRVSVKVMARIPRPPGGKLKSAVVEGTDAT